MWTSFLAYMKSLEAKKLEEETRNSNIMGAMKDAEAKQQHNQSPQTVAKTVLLPQ